MIKIGIIGHYGKGYQCLDGQTVKTKVITRELIELFGKENVMVMDTHGGLEKIPKLVTGTWKMAGSCKNVIIMPARNGIKLFVPLLALLKCFFHNNLIYIVVGGWLDSYLNEHKLVKAGLKVFDMICVETEKMRDALVERGYRSISILPNCKRLNILRENELAMRSSIPMKFCIFSRVMKEKGIGEAVAAIRKVNESYGKILCCLDIYGQIASEYHKEFYKLQNDFPEYIHYKGMVTYDKATDILKQYEALIFDTYYDGEGMAGTVIDAMAAGLPVIASDWKYNNEIVRDAWNGALVKPCDINELANMIEKIIENREKWNSLKVNCIKNAQKYDSRKCIRTVCKGLV